MKYEWGDHTYTTKKVSAQVVGETIVRLAKRDVVVTPAAFVEEARRKAKLRPLFDFDDVEGAAQRAWEQDARQIMNSVRVVVAGDGPRPIAFGHIKVVTKDGEREGYAPMAQIVQHVDLHQQVLDEALRYLAGFRKRYEQLAELGPVFVAIEAVEEAAKRSTAA